MYCRTRDARSAIESPLRNKETFSRFPYFSFGTVTILPAYARSQGCLRQMMSAILIGVPSTPKKIFFLRLVGDGATRLLRQDPSDLSAARRSALLSPTRLQHPCASPTTPQSSSGRSTGEQEMFDRTCTLRRNVHLAGSRALAAGLSQQVPRTC